MVPMPPWLCRGTWSIGSWPESPITGESMPGIPVLGREVSTVNAGWPVPSCIALAAGSARAIERPCQRVPVGQSGLLDAVFAGVLNLLLGLEGEPRSVNALLGGCVAVGGVTHGVVRRSSRRLRGVLLRLAQQDVAVPGKLGLVRVSPEVVLVHLSDG